MNNLTNGRLIPRNGANGMERTNVTDAVAAWFRSVSGDGDLHLARAVSLVVGRGTPVPEVAADLDGKRRGSPPDVGAYEFQPRAAGR